MVREKKEKADGEPERANRQIKRLRAKGRRRARENEQTQRD